MIAVGLVCEIHVDIIEAESLCRWSCNRTNGIQLHQRDQSAFAFHANGSGFDLRYFPSTDHSRIRCGQVGRRPKLVSVISLRIDCNAHLGGVQHDGQSDTFAPCSELCFEPPVLAIAPVYDKNGFFFQRGCLDAQIKISVPEW